MPNLRFLCPFLERDLRLLSLLEEDDEEDAEEDLRRLRRLLEWDLLLCPRLSEEEDLSS